MGRPYIFTSSFLLSFLIAGIVLAYPVGMPFNLEQLNRQADIILKVQVVDSKPAKDDWFESTRGFKVMATEMKVISSVKGETVQESIRFHHYAMDDEEAFMYQPQYYTFEKDRHYILLAKTTDDPKVFRQCWKRHTMKYDQGVVLASSDDRTCGDSLKEVYWDELTGFLDSAEKGNPVPAPDLVYAISQLDQMSSSHHDSVQHFDRLTVMNKVAPFIRRSQKKVAMRAIELLGTRNPYTSTKNDIFWLASHGGRKLSGIGDSHGDFINAGGSLYWKDLVDVANSDVAMEVKVTAIRALGRAGRPALLPHIKQWLNHDAKIVREAATALLGDFTCDETRELLGKAIKDDCAHIRRAAAQAIAYGQRANCLEMVEPLLADNSEVTATAALSLVSFPLDHSRDLLKRHTDHEHFGIIFINVLAEEELEPFLAALRDYIEKYDNMSVATPPDWWGGSLPWGVAWEHLLAYANSQPEMEVQSDEFKPILDALEKCIVAPQSEDGKARVGSQVPTGIYRLYIQKGMNERAEKFRKICKDNLSYDADHYFNQIHKY